MVVLGTFGAKGRWFESTSRHVGTLGKSFTRSCLYACDVASCVAALPRLLSFTCKHYAMCEILYIKRTYVYIILERLSSPRKVFGHENSESNLHYRSFTLARSLKVTFTLRSLSIVSIARTRIYSKLFLNCP